MEWKAASTVIKVFLLLVVLLSLTYFISHHNSGITIIGVVVESSVVDAIEDTVDTEAGDSVAPFNMKLLNQCLQKGYMQHYTADFDKAEEMFPDIPVMRVGRGYEWWKASYAWGGHKWYFSPSKHLTYLMNHKVGSMSFREELGYCEKTDPIEAEEVPCDFLNRAGRPFREIDASAGPNSAHSSVSNQNWDLWLRFGSRAPIKLFFNKTMIPKSQVDPRIEKILENSIKFTFVTDSISKFIGGYLERRDGTSFREKVLALTHTGDRIDYHYKPQMWHLYNAALASSAANQGNFTPPLDFVGKLNKKEAQFHWSALRVLVDERFHKGSQFINPRLVKTNGAMLTLKSVQALKKELNGADIPDHKVKHAMNMNKAHAELRQRMGNNGRMGTVEYDLARRLCAFAYAEYICFQIPFPAQCTDENGVYNITEFETNK